MRRTQKNSRSDSLARLSLECGYRQLFATVRKAEHLPQPRFVVQETIPTIAVPRDSESWIFTNSGYRRRELPPDIGEPAVTDRQACLRSQLSWT